MPPNEEPCSLGSAVVLAREAIEPVEQQRDLHLRQVHVPAQHVAHLFEVRLTQSSYFAPGSIAPAVAAKLLQSGVEHRVGGHRCASLAGGEQLVLVHAEDPDVAEAAGPGVVPSGTVGLGGVLDEWQAVPGSDLPQFVHLRHGRVEVHREERRRPRGDGRLDRPVVHAERVRVDVDEDREGAGPDDGRRARHPGQAGDDDLVTRSDAKSRQRREQGVRAMVDGYAPAGSDEGREPLGEGHVEWWTTRPRAADSPTAGAERAPYPVESASPHLRPRRPLGRRCRSATEDCERWR
jgi:hypothetical protein